MKKLELSSMYFSLGDLKGKRKEIEVGALLTIWESIAIQCQ